MSAEPLPFVKQEPPTAEPPKKNLMAKLAEIVREIDHVEKSGRNDFQKYNYVKAADVAWIVRKALSERNIYLVSDVVEIRNYEIPAREGVMQAVDVKMQFSFFDADSPETHPLVLHSYGTGTDKGDKAVYKAMTGALKYGLRHAFLIPDESDPEADEKTDKATATKAAKEVGKAKAKEMASGDKNTLFFTYPEKHNGNYAEFINVKAFGSALNEIAQEGLRLTFKKYMSKSFASKDTITIPAENMDALTQELKDCGIPLHELKAAD